MYKSAAGFKSNMDHLLIILNLYSRGQTITELTGSHFLILKSTNNENRANADFLSTAYGTGMEPDPWLTVLQQIRIRPLVWCNVKVLKLKR